MFKNTETLSKTEIRGKILFTGNGDYIIDDIMPHIPEIYQLEKCSPSEDDFRKVLERFRPHVIVICLFDESKSALRTYSALEDSPKHCNLPIIAIGSEEDCSAFKKKVFPKKMHLFVRPLDSDEFLEILDQYLLTEIDKIQRMQKSHMEAEAMKKTESSAKSGILSIEEKIEKITHEHGRKTILVVDDDVRMLNTIKLFLEDLYDIIVVPSGKLALKYLSKKTADLVLLDYMMPDEDGPTVLKQIRKVSPNPDVPVLFLTGVADKDMVMRGLEFLPNGYLLKPVTRELLLEKTTEILLGLY